MGSNREQYQSFTPAMSLADYKTQIKAGVGSPDRACGANEGSFLACYLMQGLGVRSGSPAKTSAERLAFLVDNEKDIQDLVQKQGCQIRFNSDSQLTGLFSGLVCDIPVYEKLLDLNYITLDATTSKQETFVHVYFRKSVFNSVEKIKEALDFLVKYGVDVNVIDSEKNTYARLLLNNLKDLNRIKDEAVVLALRPLFEQLITKHLVNDVEKGKAVYEALAGCYDKYRFFHKQFEVFGGKNLYHLPEVTTRARMAMLHLCLDSLALMGELGFNLGTILYLVDFPDRRPNEAVTGFRLLLRSMSLFGLPPETKRRYYRLLASNVSLPEFVSTNFEAHWSKKQLSHVLEFPGREPLVEGVFKEGKELPHVFPADKHDVRLPSITGLSAVLVQNFMKAALNNPNDPEFNALSGLKSFLSIAKGDNSSIDYNIVFYSLCNLGRNTENLLFTNAFLDLLTKQVFSKISLPSGCTESSIRDDVYDVLDECLSKSNVVMSEFSGDRALQYKSKGGSRYHMCFNRAIYPMLGDPTKERLDAVHQALRIIVREYAYQLIQKAKSGKIKTERLSNFLKLVSDEANYMSAKDAYWRYHYSESITQAALPEAYLRHGEQCGLTVLDPRDYFQVDLTYNMTFAFEKDLLIEGRYFMLYQLNNSKSYIKMYCEQIPPNFREPLRLTCYRDLTVLRHLHQVGYSFNTPECEQAITDHLMNNDLANPSFYRFMECLAQCNARFPAVVSGKPLVQFITEKYPTLTKEHREQSARHYIETLLSFAKEDSLAELMGAFPAAMEQKIPAEHKADVQALKNYLVSEAGVALLAKAQEKAWYAFVKGLVNPMRVQEAELRQLLLSTQGQEGQRQINGVKFIKLIDGFLKKLNNVKDDKDKTVNSIYPIFAPVLVHMASGLAETIKLRLHDKISAEKTDGAGEPGANKLGRFDSLKISFRKRVDMKLTPKAKQFLEEVLVSLAKLVVSPLPEAVGERWAYLEAYQKLRAELLEVMNPKDKASSIAIGSRTIRDAIKSFLLTEDGQASFIAVDDLMAKSIDDYLGSDLKQVKPSAPLADDYVPPEAPKGEPSPVSLADNSMTMYGGTATSEPESAPVKLITMFPENEYPSRAFFTNVESYEANIRRWFYNKKSGDALIEVIDKINVYLEGKKAEEIDLSLAPLVCPVTKKVPFYPCGLKDSFGSLDLQALKVHFGKEVEIKIDDEVEKIVVNEASLRLFEMQELKFFFTLLLTVAPGLLQSVEEQPAPRFA